jgi:hypothetical protein
MSLSSFSTSGDRKQSVETMEAITHHFKQQWFRAQVYKNYEVVVFHRQYKIPSMFYTFAHLNR